MLRQSQNKSEVLSKLALGFDGERKGVELVVFFKF